MMRKLGTAVLILCAFGFIIYSGLWLWYAQTINKNVHTYIENLRFNGNHMIVKNLDVRGYPLNMQVYFEGRISSNGYIVEIPNLTVNSLFLPGKNITVTFEDGLTITEPYDPKLWSADYLSLEGIIPEYMPESLTREDMQIWYQNNGSILVSLLELKKNDLLIKGNGLLSLDQNLQPKGRFQAVITGHMNFLQWLKTNSYIETKEALLSATVLSGLTRTNEGDNTAFMPVDLIVENQVLYVGPLRVVTLPKVIWPWKELDTIPLDQLQ